jgi:hypothetical protein
MVRDFIFILISVLVKVIYYLITIFFCFPLEYVNYESCGRQVRQLMLEISNNSDM